ncbi:MAG: DUF3108 domain-containing protein [Desulfobaccales bacterium]
MKTPSRLARALPCLALLLVVQLYLPTPPAMAASSPVIREDLEYQVNLGPCSDVSRVHLVLKELESGRYLAEVTGATQGLGQLSNHWLPERYQTEMVFRDGRLVPLIYREEFTSNGQHILKEYRFDHESGRVSLWRQADRGDSVKQWEVPMKSPVYDFLSFFYNVRLGVFGPLPSGSTLKVMLLSTSAPREMFFMISLAAGKVRKVTLDRHRSKSKAVNQYFCYLSPEQVPTLAWTRVPLLGRLTARLLNPGEIKKEGLLSLPASSSPAPKAQP